VCELINAKGHVMATCPIDNYLYKLGKTMHVSSITILVTFKLENKLNYGIIGYAILMKGATIIASNVYTIRCFLMSSKCMCANHVLLKNNKNQIC